MADTATSGSILAPPATLIVGIGSIVVNIILAWKNSSSSQKSRKSAEDANQIQLSIKRKLDEANQLREEGNQNIAKIMTEANALMAEANTIAREALEAQQTINNGTVSNTSGGDDCLLVTNMLGVVENFEKDNNLALLPNEGLLNLSFLKIELQQELRNYESDVSLPMKIAIRKILETFDKASPKNVVPVSHAKGLIERLKSQFESILDIS